MRGGHWGGEGGDRGYQRDRHYDHRGGHRGGDDFEQAIGFLQRGADDPDYLFRILQAPERCRISMTRENRKGRTLLMEAAKNGKSKCLEMIVSVYKASPHLGSSEHGDTALHYAAYSGKLECVKALISFGATATQKNGRRETAYHSALAGGNEDCAAVLEEACRQETVFKSVKLEDFYARVVKEIGEERAEKLLDECRERESTTTEDETAPAVLVSTAGYWIGEGACEEHAFDQSLCDEIITFLRNEREALQLSKDDFTVVDFGCGMGKYVRAFKDNGLNAEGYDGNPATPKLTEGLCSVQDLSTKFELAGGKRTWVMSLEVGEHLPRRFEQQFLDNVCHHAEKGIILSWARPGQGGFGHFNEQPDSYIKEQVLARGFEVDARMERILRERASVRWFKDTLMVFRRANVVSADQLTLPTKKRKLIESAN